MPKYFADDSTLIFCPSKSIYSGILSIVVVEVVNKFQQINTNKEVIKGREGPVVIIKSSPKVLPLPNNL